MKDSRFIELVNLYIDRQISPVEASELELEIQRDPRRRDTYRQYCRLHRASKLVYENFRSQADEVHESARQPASIGQIRARARRRRARWVYASASLAAAACVALAFYLAGSRGPSKGETLLAQADSQSQAARMIAVQPSATPVDSILQAEQQRADRTDAPLPGDYEKLLTTLRQEQDRILGPTTEPTRISLFDDGVFEDRSLNSQRLPASFQPRRARSNAEFTAFQFQR